MSIVHEFENLRKLVSQAPKNEWHTICRKYGITSYFNAKDSNLYKDYKLNSAMK